MNFILMESSPGWLLNQLTKLLESFINDSVGYIFGFAEEFFTNITWIVDSSEVTSLLYIVVALAVMLLTFMGLKQLLTVNVLEIAGDPDSSPLQHFVKIFLALALITSHPFIFNTIMDMVDSAYDIFIGSALIENTDWITALSQVIVTILTLGIFPMIMTIVYVIVFGLLLFKGLKRAIELAMLKLLFPLFCVDLVTAGGERFKKYMQSYLVVAFGFIIQMFLLRMSINRMLMPSDLSAINMFYPIALLLFAVKAPDWLQQYTYSSGVGQKSSAIARSAGQVGVQLLRVAK